MKPAARQELQRTLIELQFTTGVLAVAVADKTGRNLGEVAAPGIGPTLLAQSKAAKLGPPDALARLMGETEFSCLSDGDISSPPSLHCALLEAQHVLFVVFDAKAVDLETIRSRSREAAQNLAHLLHDV